MRSGILQWYTCDSRLHPCQSVFNSCWGLVVPISPLMIILTRNKFCSISGLVLGEAIEKMRVYSGHDATLTTLLAALDMWNFTLANYASYVAFELYKDTKNGDFFFKV